MKLTDAQTLAEISSSATDAVLQIPGQVQKFQQQIASILAPFNISSLTSGEAAAAKTQSAYCRPDSLKLIDLLGKAAEQVSTSKAATPSARTPRQSNTTSANV